MDYKKPSKAKANEDFLRKWGIEIGKSYAEETIDPNKTFLIICEGENTEPLYFKGFPVPSKKVVIEGGCHSKTSLVEHALKIRNEEKYAGREVWCVFDFDRKPDEAATQPQDFNHAINLAEKNGMNVAWSNDAFELWFLLHYNKLEAPLSRKEIYPILKEKWELDSFSRQAKTRDFCEGHYERHLKNGGSSQELAIKRARELHNQHNGNRNFANQCPCTTVYLLVEELNKYSK
jgi:hypothetical protein